MQMISLKRMQRVLYKKQGELFAIQLRSQSPPTVQNDLVEEYADIFWTELPNELPLSREVDFEIHLKSETPPSVRPVIGLSTEEITQLRHTLEKFLQRGCIRRSSSPYGAPVFFIKKKSGDLRMVCDFRALNRITIPDSTPWPLIEEAFDQVSGAKIFSHIDLIGAYPQMRVKDSDCHKTSIRTRYGSFEWRVLCFGLTNAPAAFSRLIVTLLRDLNGRCIVVYLDDILVYSNSIEEHRLHLRKLFDILREHKLYAHQEKCFFGTNEVDLLGFRIATDEIKTQDRLFNAILDCPTPSTLKHVQQFIGLANFYRRFINNYARIDQPITDLLRQKHFLWKQSQMDAFELLKNKKNAYVRTDPSPPHSFQDFHSYY